MGEEGKSISAVWSFGDFHGSRPDISVIDVPGSYPSAREDRRLFKSAIRLFAIRPLPAKRAETQH